MQIQIGGIGFFENKVNVSCQVFNDNIRGHLEITVTQEEYKEALINDTLIELATGHITNMVNEVAQIQQVKIENLQSKINVLENSQQQSNISIVMMLAELENRLPTIE